MTTQLKPGAPAATRWWPIIAIGVVLLIAAIAPKSWLAPLDLVGYAVCHRIPQRSFFVDQTQLPVCARDTGMFAAALLSMIFLLATQTGTPGAFPARRFLPFYALFFAAWGFDGFNSYYLLLRGETLLYMPQNWLRLVTGALMGVTLGTFAMALFNQGLWRDADERPVVASARSFAGLVIIAAVVCALALWRPAPAYGPLAVLSAGGAVVLLSLVNGMLVVVLRQRHGALQHGRAFAPYLCAGIALTIIEIGAIASIRLTYFPQILSGA